LLVNRSVIYYSLLLSNSIEIINLEEIGLPIIPLSNSRPIRYWNKVTRSLLIRNTIPFIS